MAWSDQKIEDIVGALLRTGVTLSAVVVFAGALIYLAHHGRATIDYRVFHGEPAELRSLSGILHTAFALNGQGIIQLGLILLILTPVARVAFSILGFAAEHDRMYVTFTTIVLAILLYSLLGSGSAF
jgi:uncharacterized membrane protein